MSFHAVMHAVASKTCMETAMNSFDKLAEHSRDYARLLLTIGENRIELLAVELQQELRRFLCMITLMLGVAVFVILAGIALTAALVLTVNYPPATVLLSVAGIYILAGVIIYWRLTRLIAHWEFLSASLSQIRKDRQCSET